MSIWKAIQTWFIKLFANVSAVPDEESRSVQDPEAPKKEQDLTPVYTEDLPWMKYAKAMIGIKEPDPRIKEFHKSANYNADYQESWCSSFLCWCFEKAGYPSTNDPAARSWLNWGIEIEQPKYGCVVVLWRESLDSWKGHVGFYFGENKGEVFLLGGNQSDSVKVQAYPKTRILGYRWPKSMS